MRPLTTEAIVIAIIIPMVVVPPPNVLSGRPFDNLVQLSSIKPDTSALGAKVDFNPLTLGQGQ